MSKLLDIFRPLLLQTVVSLNQVYAQYPPCQAQLQQVHAVLGQLPADQLFAVGRVIGRVVPDHLMALLSGDLTPMLQSQVPELDALQLQWLMQTTPEMWTPYRQELSQKLLLIGMSSVVFANVSMPELIHIETTVMSEFQSQSSTGAFNYGAFLTAVWPKIPMLQSVPLPFVQMLLQQFEPMINQVASTASGNVEAFDANPTPDGAISAIQTGMSQVMTQIPMDFIQNMATSLGPMMSMYGMMNPDAKQ